MFVILKTIKVVFILCVLLVLGSQQYSYAACSAGIPCTDYDLPSDPLAGTDPLLNGLKGGFAACDGNFMNQIYSKAYMEASREVIMSEQLIHKPDSVLEYTCFDQRIAMTANYAGPIFSEKADDETDDSNDEANYEDREVCLSTGDETASAGDDPSSCANTTTYSVFYEQDHLDNVLEPLLLASLQAYIDGNFSHTFMGEAISLDNNIDTTSITQDTSYAYNCPHMAAIWNVAKCIDFGEDDRFRSFEHLVNSDPRSIPTACSPGNISTDSVEAGSNPTKLDSTSATTNPTDGVTEPCPAAADLTAGVNTGISPNLIRVANACDDAGIEQYVSFDFAKLHDNLTKAIGLYASGAVTTCGAPRPTGVPVVTYYYTDIGAGFSSYTFNEIDRTADIFYDHVCINPGCKYLPSFPGPFYEPGDPIPTSVPSPGTCVPI